MANDPGLQAVVETDAAVVGSGAGGGVAAAVLATAGCSVIVIEKGAYVHPSKIPDNDADALKLSYECATLLSTADSGLLLLAGSGLGGGTRVNWCASFRTPQVVRHEWATRHGLEFVAGQQYVEALDVVIGRLGVHEAPAIQKDLAAKHMHAGIDVRTLRSMFTSQALERSSCIYCFAVTPDCCIYLQHVWHLAGS